MGQIADDMIDGTTCSWCGSFFRHPDNKDQLYTHGYPVVCRECWADMSPRERNEAERNGHQRAIAKTL